MTNENKRASHMANGISFTVNNCGHLSASSDENYCLTDDFVDTGYPHDGRADNAAYRHDRRADKRRYPHDREIDIQMLNMFRNLYILS